MANATVQKKANANGCPIFSNGTGGAIPVDLTEPGGGRVVACWLRPASSLFAAANAGGPVLFDETEMPARRAADEFMGGHVRTTAEQAADIAATATATATATKRANMTNALHALVVPGGPWGAFASRTNEQKAITALAYLLLSDE